ncbi:MAG: hypothetical protein HKN62_09280 [Phycisphaerales bacterium]|nr:hypothetical protein [Phycisphaerales bacterium]
MRFSYVWLKTTFVAVGLAATLAVTPATLAAGTTCGGLVDCPADFDGSGDVGFADLLALLSAWGPCDQGCGALDLDGSGDVGFADLLSLLSAWGPCGVTDDVVCIEMAGNDLAQYPFVEFVLAYNAGTTVRVAIDPGDAPAGDQTADVYIVAARSFAEWSADQTLTDVRGAPQTANFGGGTIQANSIALTGSGGLSADAGLGIGVGYDLVADFNENGVLDAGDYIDGRGDTSGFYMVHDLVAPGPLAVTELTYNVPGWPGAAGYQEENTFYPTNIASMGQLPLIVMSRGNGHNYQWYDHLGFHMASYGYVFMSHDNHTEPGVFTASTTTLQHTDQFLEQLPNIAGGVLEGHIDTSNIVWIGHSRGGEGVTIAYDRLFDGTWIPEQYTIDSIKLVSSIAPTDFQGPGQTNPHDVNYHLWTGGGDSDVNGCANCNLCQTFHLHDRAEQARQSISLHGVGHGNFHNGGGNPWFTGPCAVGSPDTHKIMKGYLLPMVKHYVEGNIPAEDFLWRQYESFAPIGWPSDNACVTGVDLMYREGDGDKFVIDDFQSQASKTISSSGGVVVFSTPDLSEGDLDDANSSFTASASDVMNGMTVGGPSDSTRGVVFSWNANAFYEQEVVGAARDFTTRDHLSFRACQATRHANTIAVLGDLTFTVTLRDGNGTTSSINIGAFGGGIEEPYQRTGCGSGTGWANEFEVIRIRLSGFEHNDSGIDLTDIVAVRFDFGPAWGSSVGRLGMDDIELVSD